MKILNEIETYRILVAFAAVSYITLYLGWGWGINIYNDEMFQLLSYDGLGITLILPDYIYKAVDLAWAVSFVGMFFFVRIARYLFVLLIISSTIMSLFWGIRVTSPAVTLNVEVLNLLVGGVLVFSYLGSVGNKFVSIKTQSNKSLKRDAAKAAPLS